MSLRTRVAIAVGVVVFCALAIVAAVIYPAVGANLRGQDDESLMQVAKKAPTIAAKLKQARTPLGQLVPFGNTQLQIVPASTAGPTNGFVNITDHDVQVADGPDKPYFHDQAYGSVVYRIYSATWSTTRRNGARPMAASASRQPAGRSRSATPGREFPPTTCRTSSIAFTGRQRRGRCPVRASASRSCAGSPTCTTEPSKQFRCSKG